MIGNGDITSPEAAVRMFETTGVDAVMIGRGCEGNPWIFSRIKRYLETGEMLPPPTKEETAEMLLRHARMLLEYKGIYTGIREMRKHVAWYTAGFPHSAQLRRAVNEVNSYEELVELIESRFLP